MRGKKEEGRRKREEGRGEPHSHHEMVLRMSETSLCDNYITQYSFKV
jgi:hypothetical protein